MDGCEKYIMRIHKRLDHSGRMNLGGRAILSSVMMEVLRQLVHAVHEAARASKSSKVTVVHVTTAVRQLFPRSGVVMSEQCMAMVTQQSARRAVGRAAAGERRTPMSGSTV